MTREGISGDCPETRKILLVIIILSIGVGISLISEYVELGLGNVLSGSDTFPLWIKQWDDYFLLRINPAIINPFLNHLFILISLMGSTIVLLVLTSMFYLFGHKKEAMLILATIVLGTVIVYPLKATIIRPRPYSSLPSVVFIEQEMGSSFPSGHSERIFSFSAVLSGKKHKLALFLYFLAAVVAFSRMYLGVHYPLDVFVGSFIGWLVGKVTLRWEDRVYKLASRFVAL